MTGQAHDGIGIYATPGRSGPESTNVFHQFQAHSLGFLDGRDARQSGGPHEPPLRPHGIRLTGALWDEYRRGWDEALNAYEVDDG